MVIFCFSKSEISTLVRYLTKPLRQKVHVLGCWNFVSTNTRHIKINRKNTRRCSFQGWCNYNIPTDQFLGRVHCKPSPFSKQFCLAYTATFPSYITFQNNQQKIFNPKQMWIYEILICTFGENQIFTFVHCLFASPTSAYAFLYSI
jgi:hypothetical protein